MELQKSADQRTNVQQIIWQIIENGPISRRQLQRDTGFSWGLISQVTNRLVTEGYITAEGSQISVGVGRRAETLDIVPDDHFFVGVDINCDGMHVVVTDMKGRLVESRHDLLPRRTRSGVLGLLYELLDSLLGKYADRHITGIGVSVQGIVDMDRGVSAYISGIENWVDIPLRELLESRYGLEVITVHDTDCLMISECSFGVLKNSGAKNVLMMNYNHSTRKIGMSVMIDGRLYFGHRGRAAELGYTILGETPQGQPLLLNDYMMDSTVSCQQLCACVGKAMAIANTLYNPETVVLHIPDCPYGGEMAQTVEHWIRKGSYDATAVVKSSCLGRNAQAQGAAAIMIGRAVDRLI